IEPAELRIAGEIADQLLIGLLEPLRENPPDVAPEEAALTRRVEVGGLVGVSVVVPMVAGPPESASLCAGSAEEGEDELEAPPGLEAPVREVAMEASGEGEHPQRVDPDRQRDVAPAKRDEERSNDADRVAEVHRPRAMVRDHFNAA